MKILTSEQIRQVDRLTIEGEPVKSIDLMERAAEQCVKWITQNFKSENIIKIFVGPGNNGGDGLAIACKLIQLNYTVYVYHLTPFERLSEDCLENLHRLKKIKKDCIDAVNESNLPVIHNTDIVIDALFGTGLSRPTESLAAKIISHINNSGACVISIDIPSGLFAESNNNNSPDHIIKARFTLTFQIPKLSFFFSENEKYTGETIILNIKLLPEAIEQQISPYYFTEKKDISVLLKTRPRFSHKGTYGHALLIAGSTGKMGASVLSSQACLKTGVGLITCHIPGLAVTILQSSIPEAMISIDPSADIFSQKPQMDNYSALGIGPGIGTKTPTMEAFSETIRKCQIPLILDADAINILSQHTELLSILPENTILTPHPGEFDRLMGASINGFERHLKQLQLSKKYKLIVVLKGAFTSITTPSGLCYFNSTGNPGMATAGSGDVLTGIILSLLAQKYEPEYAALIGTYIHGLAGDIYAVNFAQESLIASDIINNLGLAFKYLKE